MASLMQFHPSAPGGTLGLKSSPSGFWLLSDPTSSSCSSQQVFKLQIAWTEVAICSHIAFVKADPNVKLPQTQVSSATIG